MLPVSVVYICWKHGDMVDAYLYYPHAQVVFMRRVEIKGMLCYQLLISDDVGLYDFVMQPHQYLWIRDKQEGIAA